MAVGGEKKAKSKDKTENKKKKDDGGEKKKAAKENAPTPPKTPAPSKDKPKKVKEKDNTPEPPKKEEPKAKKQPEKKAEKQAEKQSDESAPTNDTKTKHPRPASPAAPTKPAPPDSPMPEGSGTPSINRSRQSMSSVSLPSLQSRPSSIARPDLEVVFVEPLEKRYECPLCCQVLRYPVQFDECGHRCCSSCLPELLRVAPRCPIDQCNVDRDKVYVDKPYQKELDALEVRCSFNTGGCKWNGVLADLATHTDNCDFFVISCPNGCGVDFERRFKDKHVNEDCTCRKLSCEFCKEPYQEKDEMEHLNSCMKFPIPCPAGCKKKDIPRELMEEHLKSNCPKEQVNCPFAEAGCDHQCERKKLAEHMKAEPEKHLDIVSQALVTFKRTLELHDRTMQQQADRLVGVENKVQSLEKLYGSQLVWKIEQYNDKFVDAKMGKTQTIFSPPFLTSRHGYKMSLSACLYGDGKARSKFMSLFVCICQGDYDALLSWPFSHRITFTLIDQCQDPAARRNITYTIKPNTCKDNKPFLGRPDGDRNASFGAQKFVELEVMSTLDYVRDDCMFVKVNIDSDEMVLL